MFHDDLPAFLTDTADYAQYYADATTHLKDILENPETSPRALIKTIQTQEDLPGLRQQGQDWAQKFKTFVIFGTGGSSLGAQTLCALKQFSFSQSSCRVLFMDNIDPVTFKEFFKSINLAETGFLVVSKSGTTAETLCQFLTLLPYYSEAERPHHLFVLTEAKDSPLRQLAQQNKLMLFDHSLDIGGRFSVFTNVGLLPAAVAGVDIKKIRQGAGAMLKNPSSAIAGAALAVTALEQGYTQTVMMPYCDQLFYFTFWFRQLWAESLGKQGKGTTPINALGTVDQHSQVQLYLDGPRDKLFTLIMTEGGPKMPSLEIPAAFSDLNYLHHKNMNDLMQAEQKATLETLRLKGCPARVLTLPVLNEEVLGGLLMQYILETMITARLLSVNAFDQPAVEEGKRLTRLYLSPEFA